MNSEYSGGGKDFRTRGTRVGTRVGEKSGKRESVDIMGGQLLSYWGAAFLLGASHILVCNRISGGSSV